MSLSPTPQRHSGTAAAGTLPSCSAHESCASPNLTCSSPKSLGCERGCYAQGTPLPWGRTPGSHSPRPAGVRKAPARRLSTGSEPYQKFIQLK